MEAEGVAPLALTLAELTDLGKTLDDRPERLQGDSVVMELAAHWLRVRTRAGSVAPLAANTVQREFERRRETSNIVLKARQLGLTTWAAARFFLKTITNPGTLTLEVAHTQDAAEEIFRIVHRFVDWMPKEMREGPLRTSRSNARQIVFPELDSQYRVVSAGERNAGRGMTVQNLHCSELARWPGDPAETLAGLRAGVDAGRRADSRIDARRHRRLLSRRMAEGARDRSGAAFFSVVDGTAVPGIARGRGESYGGGERPDCEGEP